MPIPQGCFPDVAGSLYLSQEPTFFWCLQFCDNVVHPRAVLGTGPVLSSEYGDWDWSSASGVRQSPTAVSLLLLQMLPRHWSCWLLCPSKMCEHLCAKLLLWVLRFFYLAALWDAMEEALTTNSHPSRMPPVAIFLIGREYNKGKPQKSISFLFI